MDVSILQVIEGKFTTGSAQVSFLKEETTEFTSVIRPIHHLSNAKTSDIKFPSLYQEWIGDVLLDHKLSHVVGHIFTCGCFYKLSNLVEIFKDLDASASV